MEIGIRELKQRLSEIIELVCQGEHVVVTHRGMPKVTITPIAGAARLQQGIEEGWVRPPIRSGTPFAEFPIPGFVAREGSLEQFIADRED
jgi:prevent-host-death family protein